MFYLHGMCLISFQYEPAIKLWYIVQTNTLIYSTLVNNVGVVSFNDITFIPDFVLNGPRVDTPHTNNTQPKIQHGNLTI